MARIRTVKPEFFTSLDIANLSPLARLLFIGLWTNADDEGRQQNEPRLLKAAVFPLDDDITPQVVHTLMCELRDNGQIDLYTVDGVPLYQVRAWKEHQRIDRPKASKYPSPSDPRRIDDESTTNRGRVVLEGKGKEGTGPDQSGPNDERVAAVIEAYVTSVCLSRQNTNARFRDAVRNGAMTERAPLLYAAIAQRPATTDDDLRALLGLERINPAPSYYAPRAPEHDPNCELCAGSGWRTVNEERNEVGPCDCTPSLADVHPIRPDLEQQEPA